MTTLPKLTWTINPSEITKSDICLYQTLVQKNITHLKLFSPFKINVADLEYYSYVDKLFISLELMDSTEAIYNIIVEDFDSKKVEQLYLVTRKRLPLINNKLIHLYILTAAYLHATRSSSWKNVYAEMNIRSHEIGKYKMAGTEKDLVKKMKLYLVDDTIITSHTYAFILALIYHRLYSHKVTKT